MMISWQTKSSKSYKIAHSVVNISHLWGRGQLKSSWSSVMKLKRALLVCFKSFKSPVLLTSDLLRKWG